MKINKKIKVIPENNIEQHCHPQYIKRLKQKKTLKKTF